MTIPITPKLSHPLPYEDTDEVAPTLIEKLAVAGATAELQVALGAPVEITAADGRATTELFKEFLDEKAPEVLGKPGVAYTAAQFLREYAHSVAIDVNAIRTALTTKLMEIANCGDRKHELRAIELLGKHSDIGLFTERSEITIKHKSSDDLEKEITERIQRLMHADVFDVTPIIKGLDADVWGADTLRALDALPQGSHAPAAGASHPGWKAPRRMEDPEGEDPLMEEGEDFEEEEEVEDFDE